MNRFFKIFLVTLNVVLFFFTISSVTLANEFILINEVYPNPNIDEHEWIEIFNNSEESVNLAGWILMDELSSPSIIHKFDEELSESWIIEPFSFLIIELSSSKLNNSADGVKLINQNNEVINQLEYQNSEPGMSFSFIAGANQNDSNIVLSNPSKNLPNLIIENESEEDGSTEDPEESDQTDQNYLTLSISEVMSCPVDGNSEWIEIKNDNDEVVSLENWKIKDEADNQVILSETETILKESLVTIFLSNNILNNSGDTVYLFNPNNELVDKFEFGECDRGVSISSSTDGSSNTGDSITSENHSNHEPTPAPTAQDTNTSSVGKIEDRISHLKKINSLLEVINLNKISSEEIGKIESKRIIIKRKSLPKSAVISVIIGGVIISSSGLFFIKNEKNKNNI